ncbi:hypothetical protein BDR06DRAFT_1008954 [Suillus hirtellus]|nr:hypothetical protein BDR06DRAFT_1008954 [Suillus hirtellus]
MTLEGHEPWKVLLPDGDHHEYKYVSCISYSPDGKQMISGSDDETMRRWDLREGKEIEEAQEVCDDGINGVGVSTDGRWVVTAGYSLGLKVSTSEVETGIRATLVASGSEYGTARIWSLDTGELIAGPFEAGEGSLTMSVRLSESGGVRKF